MALGVRACLSSLRFLAGAPVARSPSLRSLFRMTASTAQQSTRSLCVSASGSSLSEPAATDKPSRWKPMCLYHTQGKCTMMTDSSHLEKFNHNLSLDLQFSIFEYGQLGSQDLDYFLVLDLEGKVEILEFPVLLIDAKTMNCTDIFHRFVRPTRMGEKRVNEYIEGKYGKFGLDRVWHDTAVPFKQVIQEFEAWLTTHQLLKESSDALIRAAFITCGNWDIKTKIPEQCMDSDIKLPSYFSEWINLKDIFLNFYNQKATGMMPMMRELGIPLRGSHHLGIDDAKNIARVLQRMVADGSRMQITARRGTSSEVKFLFRNRIR